MCKSITMAAAVAMGVLVFSGSVSAQTIKFYNPQGQTIRSWKLGDNVVVEVKGGAANLKTVEIGWVTGTAGASMNLITTLPYNPSTGIRYTITNTALYNQAVCFTVKVKFGIGINDWSTMNSLWRTQ